MTLGLLALAVAAAIQPAQAGPADPLVVDLFFDVAANSLAELDTASQLPTPAVSEILIAGVPLHIGTEEGDVGWRTVAGARGHYTVALGGGFSLIGRAQLSNTDLVDDNVADRTVGLAAGELRYASGGWTFGLQPGFEVTRWADGEMQQDVIAEGRASAPLLDGLRVVAAAGYRWRELSGVATSNREIGFGRLGFAGTLPHRARLNVALVTRRETADVLIQSAGPTAALVLPIGEAIDLQANYAYTATERQALTTVPAIPREGLHHLGLSMSWDIGGDDADMDLSARYGFEHRDAAGRSDELRHTGTVTLALTF